MSRLRLTANIGNLDAAISTLTGRLTAARAGYLDNLNVGGPVAARAEVDAVRSDLAEIRGSLAAMTAVLDRVERRLDRREE